MAPQHSRAGGIAELRDTDRPAIDNDDDIIHDTIVGSRPWSQNDGYLRMSCDSGRGFRGILGLPLPSSVEATFAVHASSRGSDSARSVSFIGRHGRTVLDLAREVVAVVAVYLAYQRGRMLAKDQASEAFANARLVIDFERRLNVFSERTVQRLSMHYDGVMWLLNHYYARVHFPFTTAFVIWLFFRHRETYRWVRTWLISVTMIALVIHAAFPLAPPRMLPTHGFIDTLRLDGLHIYSVDPNQSLANQFAAMPSLHFGWALIVAIAFIAVRRTPWSIVALAHPAVTLLAIVATANHYWIDAAVALLLVTGALLIVRAIHFTMSRATSSEFTDWRSAARGSQARGSQVGGPTSR